MRLFIEQTRQEEDTQSIVRRQTWFEFFQTKIMGFFLHFQSNIKSEERDSSPQDLSSDSVDQDMSSHNITIKEENLGFTYDKSQ